MRGLLPQRVAMARNCLSLAKKFSMRVTRLVDVLVVVRRAVPWFALGGITAVLPAAASRRDDPLVGIRTSLSAIQRVGLASRARGGGRRRPDHAPLPPVRKIVDRVAERIDQGVDFGVNPPRDRPIAWSSPAFFGRQRCADGHAQWCLSIHRIFHCRRQRKVAEKEPSPIHPIWPMSVLKC